MWSDFKLQFHMTIYDISDHAITINETFDENPTWSQNVNYVLLHFKQSCPPHLIYPFTPSFSFFFYILHWHKSRNVCKLRNSAQACLSITLSLSLSAFLSPHAINPKIKLYAVCPQELIISSIGREGLDLITETNWEQIGSHFHTSLPTLPAL